MLPPSEAKTTGLLALERELVAPRPVDWFLQLKTINQSRFSSDSSASLSTSFSAD